MDTIMACYDSGCDGSLFLARTLTKRSAVTAIERVTGVVCCTECDYRSRVKIEQRVMCPAELVRMLRPEECGYEHG